MERIKKSFIENLPSLIDYTNLRKDARAEDIYKLCQDAIKYNFYAVCVNPYYLSSVYEWLEERQKTNIQICSVIDFPLGQSTMSQRLYQIESSLNYAGEFDVVANIGAVKTKNYRYLRYEFKKIKDIAIDKVIKIIIETPLLEAYEIKTITEVIVDCGLDYVKTSTGTVDYPNLPPTKELKGYFSFLYQLRDVKLIKNVLAKKNSSTKIKAAGGIRTIDDCMALIAAGASRIGTSVNVLKRENQKYY